MFHSIFYDWTESNMLKFCYTLSKFIFVMLSGAITVTQTNSKSALRVIYLMVKFMNMTDSDLIENWWWKSEWNGTWKILHFYRQLLTIFIYCDWNCQLAIDKKALFRSKCVTIFIKWMHFNNNDDDCVLSTCNYIKRTH